MKFLFYYFFLHEKSKITIHKTVNISLGFHRILRTVSETKSCNLGNLLLFI